MKVDLTLEEIRLMKWLADERRRAIMKDWNRARDAGDEVAVEKIKKAHFIPIRDLQYKLELARRAALETRWAGK